MSGSDARKQRRPARPREQAAEVDPVAQVLVDVPLAHLDRPFDYEVPQTMAAAAVPGARVKVRFAGQLVDGFLVARRAASEHQGPLAPLRRVVSAEPVLSPEVAALTAAVAARYAGTRSDVLRLAVPPRHAVTEKQPSQPAPPLTARSDGRSWGAYLRGPELVAELVAGASPRVVWSALPGDPWERCLVQAVLATRESGRGALVCVPDRRDLDRIDAALSAELGPGQHVVLTADSGPAKRYAAFLAVSRAAVQIVVGTRAAAFAPVRDLGLVTIWDDGDDLYAEPRAPYPH
ncbi:MAG: primosome assembly protein PriA, partial [Actinomycetota bacterium]|nr:primosome assembly protein PriA [Actinomycetota bacterium]